MSFSCTVIKSAASSALVLHVELYASLPATVLNPFFQACHWFQV
jgi:hypothetical protein